MGVYPLFLIFLYSFHYGVEPRFDIRPQQKGRAAAGVNWVGEPFAEIYVEVEPSAKAEGYAKSVLAALSEYLLQQRKIALLRVSEDQAGIRQVAIRLGFRPTGVRLLYAQALLKQAPA